MKGRSSYGWLLRMGWVLVWVFGVVAAYFGIHKPIGGTVAGRLAETVGTVLVWGWFWLLATTMGRLLVSRWLAKEEVNFRLGVSAGIGAALISLSMLFLGVVRGYSWGVVAGIFVLLPVLLLRSTLWQTVQEIRQSVLPKAETGTERWLFFYISCTLALGLGVALAPTIGWDSHVYHLTIPKLYLQTGQIGHLKDIPYLGFPQLAQMQYTWGMVLMGDRVATLIHYGYGVLAVGMSAGIARRYFGRSAAVYTAALLLSAPTLIHMLSWAYADLTLLFYTTAAVYLLLCWWESYQAGERDNRWLVLLGVLVGCTTGVKYTAVITPFAIALVILWVAGRGGVWRVTMVAMVAGAVAAPWLIKNWLTTGNPVYPFFLQDGLYWDGWRSWFYDRAGTGLGYTEPWRLFLAPLELTVLGQEGTAWYDATVGPLLLVCGGLMPFVWGVLSAKEHTVIKVLVFILGLNLALWLSGLARTALLFQGRLLLPVFGLVAVLGGVAMGRLPALRHPRLALDWLVQIAVHLSLGLLLFGTVLEFVWLNPLPVAVGLESQTAYYERLLPDYAQAMEMVNGLPADAHLLFLWEPRSYLCQRDCEPDAILDRFLHWTHGLGWGSAEIVEQWKSAGISHILFHQAGYQQILQAQFDPVQPRDQQVLAELQNNYLIVRQTTDNGSYILYEVR